MNRISVLDIPWGVDMTLKNGTKLIVMITINHLEINHNLALK